MTEAKKMYTLEDVHTGKLGASSRKISSVAAQKACPDAR